MVILKALSLVLGIAAGDLPVVERVDLERYQGSWYEIGALPQEFEEGCVAVEAEYRLRPDGKMTVINSCRNGSFDGPWRRAQGLARVVDPSNAKLKVSFGGPFEGDYWILGLAEDYSYALVGSPDLGSLWVLSRTRTLDENVYSALLAKAEELGFSTEDVRLMPQPRVE